MPIYDDDPIGQIDWLDDEIQGSPELPVLPD